MTDKHHHVLILEDRSTDAEMALRELRREGLEFTSDRVVTERDFGNALENPGLDLILADYSLPAYDGLSALTLARRLRPEVPFIFVAGTIGEEIAINALHNGATDYVLKQRLSRLGPAAKRALMEVVERKKRRRLESDLSRQQQWLNAFFAGSSAGLAVFDRDLRFVRINEALALLDGLPPEAHLGRSLCEILPEHGHQVEPHLRSVIATGIPVVDAEFVTMEGIGRPRRHCLASYHPIVAADGAPVGIGAIVVDITGRKRAEAALAEREQRIRSLMDAMEDSVFILDRNRHLAGAYGGSVDNKQPQGQTIEEAYGADAAAAFNQVAERAFSGQSSVTYEWTRDDPTGRRYFQTRLSTMRAEHGDIAGVVGVSRDLTELRNMQTQLLISDRMASVGILAAGIAHEINNPLAVISGNLDIASELLDEAIRDPADPARARALGEAVEDARLATERVRQIVRDLKVFSRSDDTDMASAIDLPAVLESSLRMASNEIRHRAHLVRDYGSVPPVRGNESRLGQVFLNLIVNAAQAIPEGQAEHNEIRIATSTRSDGRAVVEVSDTGEGMPPEVISRLFTPFFTTKPVGSGTGLGLSICNRIIGLFGGEMSVESELGRGSKFRVVLPPSPPAEGQPASGTVLAAGGGRARRGSVLIVDDEPAIVRTVHRMLADEHEVVAVASATEALALIVDRGRRFDVIFCDLMMPQMTGMDLHDELKKSAAGQAASMVFLTGGAFTARARSFLDTVPNLRLEKPFTAQQIQEAVHDRLREASDDDAVRIAAPG